MITLKQTIARRALSWLVDAANPRERYQRPFEPQTVGPLHKEVSPHDRLQLLSDSSKLYYNLGPAKGMVDDKATYSIGRSWLPVFAGEDKAWGDAARKWLIEQWYPLADIRGQDFRTHLFLLSVSIDRDGDAFPLLTEYKTGFPAVQTVPARMIGQHDTGESKVKAGGYRGLAITDGVITNDVGTPVAFRILTSDKDHEDISARDMVQLYDPVAVDQLRGLPAFTHAILDLKNLRQVQGYEMLASALASSIGLIEHNDNGMPDPSDPTYALTMRRSIGGGSVASNTGNPIAVQEMLGGMVKYFKANSGNKLESFKNDRPGEAWEKLMNRLIRNAAVGAGWPFEMAWDVSALGGANTRLIIAKAMRAVEDRQDLIRPYARRAIGYACRKAIKQGILPDSKDWYKWGFTMPAKLTADYGRNKQADREDYAAGLTSMTRILGEEGISLDDHLRELTEEREKMMNIAPVHSAEPDDEDDEEEGLSESAKREEAQKLEAQSRHNELLALAASPRQNITVQPPNITVNTPDIVFTPRFDVPQPTITVEGPQIDVNVPEQRAPNVTVNVPDQPAPVIHVAAAELPMQPAPIINVEAPNVTVNVPPLNAEISIKRDRDGRIKAADITDK